MKSAIWIKFDLIWFDLVRWYFLLYSLKSCGSRGLYYQKLRQKNGAESDLGNSNLWLLQESDRLFLWASIQLTEPSHSLSILSFTYFSFPHMSFMSLCSLYKIKLNWLFAAQNQIFVTICCFTRSVEEHVVDVICNFSTYFSAKTCSGRDFGGCLR